MPDLVLVENGDNPNTSRPEPAEPGRVVVEMAELVGGLAHELRNPLSSMMINLKLLAEDLQASDADTESARRRALLKVDAVQREAERLKNLFDEFLSLTSSYRLRRTETDVNAVVSALVEFFDPQAKDSGVKIELVFVQDPIPCLVDPKLLRQAMLNIVLNAQQAMPSGGLLRITTACEDDDVTIAISDTGVGIPREDRERILRPFFSTKAEGNGLGLSITQRIIREHGGSLSFQSEPGAGTTFTIRLPRRPHGREDPAAAG